MSNKFFLLLCVYIFSTLNQGFAQNENLEPLNYNGRGTVLLRVPGPQQSDTVYFKNGVATYNPEKYLGEIGWLYLTDIDPNQVHYLTLEKGPIIINVTKDSMIFIHGTPNNNSLFKLDETLEPLRRKMKIKQREVAILKGKGEIELADVKQKDVMEVSKIWWAAQKDFALGNGQLAGLVYVTKLQSKFSTEELKPIIDKYQKFSESNAYKALVKRYNIELTTDIGVVPPPFNLVSDKGKMVSLSAAMKRLTIIDFWASWCKPCRAENPNLITLFENWKKKGLEIISISIDKVEDKDKWLKAIKEDNINWVQVWDEMGTANKDYGITAIPRTFLLNENGKIVAKDLRGEELNKFVGDYLK